jgi:hypothetical protein
MIARFRNRSSAGEGSRTNPRPNRSLSPTSRRSGAKPDGGEGGLTLAEDLNPLSLKSGLCALCGSVVKIQTVQAEFKPFFVMHTHLTLAPGCSLPGRLGSRNRMEAAALAKTGFQLSLKIPAAPSRFQLIQCYSSLPGKKQHGVSSGDSKSLSGSKNPPQIYDLLQAATAFPLGEYMRWNNKDGQNDEYDHNNKPGKSPERDCLLFLFMYLFRSVWRYFKRQII